MIYYLLLLLSIILAVCKSSVYNTYAKKTRPTLFATFGFNAATYGIAAVIAFTVMMFGDKTLSAPTVFCALLYAAVVFSLQTISITAMKVGAMSLTSICVMYGMIIPSLAGPIFWKEPFGVLQAVGIGMMLVSLWFLRGKGDNRQSSVSKKWILLAAIAFLLSGMAGVMEKIHQSTEGRAEKAMFVFVACLAMLMLSVVASALSYHKKSEGVTKKPLLALGALSGFIIGFYSIVNLTLAGALDSMIYYPVANGGAMLLTVTVSFVIFKEPLDRRKIFGAVIGLFGIVCLSIPI